MYSVLNKNKVWIIFIGFVIGNLLLKLPFCSIPSISNDEAFSIFYSQYPILEIPEVFKEDTNPPFFYMLLHGWIFLFGISEFAVRSFSVVLFSLSGGMLFLVGNRFFSFRVGFLAALFYSVSLSNIYYAAEVRTFSLVLFLATVSIYSYLQLFYNAGEKKGVWACLLGISSLMLLYSHYLTVCLLLVEFAFALRWMKTSRAGFNYYLMSQCFSALLFMPWVFFVFKNMPESGVFWLKTPTLKNLFFGSFNLAGSRVSLFLLLFLLLSVPLMRRLGVLKKIENTDLFMFFLFVWLFPVFGLFLLGQLTPVFLLRYFLYAGIGLFIVEACILDWITNKLIRIFFTVLCISFLLSEFNPAPEKEENWREAAEYIKSIDDEHSRLLISASYKARDLLYYLNQDTFRDYANFERNVEKELVRVNSPEELKEKKIVSRKLIVVFSHNDVVDPEGKLMQLIEDNYDITSSKEFKRVNVYTCTLKGA